MSMVWNLHKRKRRIQNSLTCSGKRLKEGRGELRWLQRWVALQGLKEVLWLWRAVRHHGAITAAALPRQLWLWARRRLCLDLVQLKQERSNNETSCQRANRGRVLLLHRGSSLKCMSRASSVKDVVPMQG